MKVKVKTSLIEAEKVIEKSSCTGIKVGEVINFKDKNIKNKIFLKDNNIKIIRSSPQYKITLDFSNNKCEYLLIDENQVLNLQIITKEIIIEEGLLKINYKVDTKDIDTMFILEYEVVEWN